MVAAEVAVAVLVILSQNGSPTCEVLRAIYFYNPRKEFMGATHLKCTRPENRRR